VCKKPIVVSFCRKSLHVLKKKERKSSKQATKWDLEERRRPRTNKSGTEEGVGMTQTVTADQRETTQAEKKKKEVGGGQRKTHVTLERKGS